MARNTTAPPTRKMLLPIPPSSSSLERWKSIFWILLSSSYFDICQPSLFGKIFFKKQLKTHSSVFSVMMLNLRRTGLILSLKNHVLLFYRIFLQFLISVKKVPVQKSVEWNWAITETCGRSFHHYNVTTSRISHHFHFLLASNKFEKHVIPHFTQSSQFSILPFSSVESLWWGLCW